jgi:hypothetical protein
MAIALKFLKNSVVWIKKRNLTNKMRMVLIRFGEEILCVEMLDLLVNQTYEATKRQSHYLSVIKLSSKD